MLISIPPQYALSQVVGYIKGKSAIHIASTSAGRQQNFTGQSFWARGYSVSTSARDEETIRRYIEKQEELDNKIDDMNFTEIASSLRSSQWRRATCNVILESYH